VPASAAAPVETADWVADGGAGATGAARQTPVASQAPAASQSPAAPTSLPTPSSGGGKFISLSAGVALPQLLPEGTQIGVSVDYRLSGSLKTSSRYFLVVESKAGEIALPVTLEPAGGTLQGFLPLAIRPEHEPFRAQIDELPAGGKRTMVSNSAVLATSY
jgi:hypothetical protein